MPDISHLLVSYRRYALYERGHRPSTVNQTVNIVNRLCEFARTDNIKMLDTPTIRAFLQTQREEIGWSAKTFRIYRQSLKTFFAWILLQGLRSSNPVSAIGNPTLPSTIPRCLTKDQALCFLAHARSYRWFYELEGSRNEAIIATFLYAGLRLCELINLRSDEVFLEQSEIRITQGKNRKDRLIAIHPHLRPILIAYQFHRQRLGTPSIWYFPSVKSEKRLTPKNIQIIFRRISSSCEIKATPHMLRHTCGRLYVEENVNLRVIQLLLGHSRIETTERYTFVSIETMKMGLARSRPL